MIEGIILKGIGGFYYVDTAEGLIECKARGRFRKTVGKPIVGDRVTLEIQPEDGTGYLQTIAPRKNKVTKTMETGTVGYEIPFTRYFYEYKPLRKSADILADLRELVARISGELVRVVG